MSALFDASSMVVPFERLRMTDVEAVGGKNASLGEMISQLPTGVNVPTGFATTAHAFRQFLQHGLRPSHSEIRCAVRPECVHLCTKPPGARDGDGLPSSMQCLCLRRAPCVDQVAAGMRPSTASITMPMASMRTAALLEQ